MKKIILLLIAFVALSVFNHYPAQAAAGEHRHIYDVKAGDNLTGIAKKYGTSVTELKTTNGLHGDSLFSGQRLFVPMKYLVKRGDTLWKIASAYNSTVPLIKSANSLKSDSIAVGQILKIPQKKLNMQGQYVLMTRAEFQDWLFHHVFSRKVTLVQQHHTWSPSYKHFNGSNHFSLLKGMENYHVNNMKWKNIAQNITTFPDGKIAVSRPFNMAPEGSIGATANATGIAIENVGNFDSGHDAMTAEQRETIIYITALLHMKFGLTPSVDSITYHHWWDMRTGKRVLDDSKGFSVKTCPGTNFFGGNSTANAKKNFYPLVLKKMQEIRKTLN